MVRKEDAVREPSVIVYAIVGAFPEKPLLGTKTTSPELLIVKEPTPRIVAVVESPALIEKVPVMPETTNCVTRKASNSASLSFDNTLPVRVVP
jgi:hypothetical protein